MTTEIALRDTPVPRPISDAIRLAVDIDPNLDVYIAPDEANTSAVRARGQLVVEILSREGALPATAGEGPELMHVMGALMMLRVYRDMAEVTNEIPELNTDKARPAITQRSYRAKFERQSLKMTLDIEERINAIRRSFFRRAA